MLDVLPGVVLAVVLLGCWLAYIGRPDGSMESGGLKHFLHRIWRRLTFWLGDVRFYWQWWFGFLPLPGCSWTHHEYAVSYEDLLRVCKHLKPGDVMLATKGGYWFSNTAIPGCFKHAGIIVRGPTRGLCHDKSIISLYDPSVVRLVEAVSEGVVKRHPLYARADRMIFVRPKHQEDDERERAAALARKFVGCKYDASFNFNITEEVEYLESQPGSRGADFHEDVAELKRCQMNHQAEFDLAFSCTETVAAAWWFRRRQLGITRKRVRGRMCIIADQFVNRDFQIVWTNVTVDQAKKAGLVEEGLRELEAYWREHE